MASYTKAEARDWAREKMFGVANVTIPTMKSDFRTLNEKAIRHDVDKAIEHGFVASLSCSEVAFTTPEQYGEFCEIMVDQAKGRMFVVHHACFNTLEDNIAEIRRAEAAGAELVLLAYPPYFFPKTLEDLYAYTKAICDSTNLGVMLFAHPSWGFQRLHPADLPVPLVRRLIDECPNVVALKVEGGMPYVMEAIEAHRHFHKELVISSPIEYEYVPLAQVIDIPFCGTNYASYFGSIIPRIHKLINDGQMDAATEMWYKIDPARKAIATVPMGGRGLINRTKWKYEGWLQGYNGGPLPHPTQRVLSNDMAILRGGLERSGLVITADSDEQFFVGRHPD